MTDQFTNAINEIKALTNPNCTEIGRVLFGLWQNRPDTDEDGEWEREFGSMFPDIWSLSTCKNQQLRDVMKRLA